MSLLSLVTSLFTPKPSLLEAQFRRVQSKANRVVDEARYELMKVQPESIQACDPACMDCDLFEHARLKGRSR